MFWNIIADEVQFGEVAMQPPDLMVRPRKSTPNKDKVGTKIIQGQSFCLCSLPLLYSFAHQGTSC